MVATSLRIHFTIGGDIVNLCFWCMIGEYINALTSHESDDFRANILSRNVNFPTEFGFTNNGMLIIKLLIQYQRYGRSECSRCMYSLSLCYIIPYFN